MQAFGSDESHECLPGKLNNGGETLNSLNLALSSVKTRRELMSERYGTRGRDTADREKMRQDEQREEHCSG